MDWEDWIEHGILVVNVSFEGYPYALRVKVFEVEDVLP